MSGGAGGDDDGASEIFAKQCEGLQGLWEEVDQRSKKWVVNGTKAHRQIKAGVSPRGYTLCEGSEGGLVWGINGQYVLEPSFKPGDKIARWLRASATGAVAFSWENIGSITDVDLSTREWNAQGKGKSKSGGKGKTKGKGESYRQGKAWVDDWSWSGWWEESTPSFGNQYMAEERQIDHVAGEENVWEAWSNERRVDHDGKAYTWDELRSFYSAEYTKKDMEAYWAELRPGAGRGKGYGKDMGKGGMWNRYESKGKGCGGKGKFARGKGDRKGKDKGK